MARTRSGGVFWPLGEKNQLRNGCQTVETLPKHRLNKTLCLGARVLESLGARVEGTIRAAERASRQGVPACLLPVKCPSRGGDGVPAEP